MEESADIIQSGEMKKTLNYIEKIEHSSPKLVGRVYALIAGLIYSGLTFSAKKLENGSSESVAFLRGFSGLVILIIFVRSKHILMWPQDKAVKNLYILRICLGGIGIGGTHKVISILPLQVVAALLTLEIPYTVLVASIVFKRKNKPKFWVLVFLGLVGTTFIIDPSLIGIGTPNYTVEELSIFGIVLINLSSIVWAFDWVLLAERSLPYEANGILYCFATVVGSSLASILHGGIYIPPSLNNLFFGVGIGISNLTATYINCRAIKLNGSSGEIVAIFSINVLFTFYLDITFLGTRFSGYALFGSIVLLFAVCSIILDK